MYICMYICMYIEGITKLECHYSGNLDSIAYQCLLKNELLGAGIVDLKHSSNLLSDGVADPSGSAANAVGSVSSINNASSSHSSPTNGSCGGMRRRVLYPKENTSLFQVLSLTDMFYVEYLQPKFDLLS